VEIRYVDDRGDADFATIREATAAAPRGDVISVLPGTYASGFAGKAPHPTIQLVTVYAASRSSSTTPPSSRSSPRRAAPTPESGAGYGDREPLPVPLLRRAPARTGARPGRSNGFHMVVTG